MMTSERLIDELRAVLARYQEISGHKPSTIGMHALNSPSFFVRLGEDDASVSTAMFDRAMIWFAENWPRAERWPRGVPRPTQADIERVREQRLVAKAG
jgi:hypothetical protein